MTAFDDFTAGIAIQAPRLAATTSGKLAGMRGAKTALNVLLDAQGIKPGTGYTRIFDAPLPAVVRGLHYYHFRGVGSSIDEILAVSNGTLYANAGTAWLSRGAGLTDVPKTRLITWNGYALLMNGTDAVQQYSGGAVGSVTFADPETILPTPFHPQGAWIHRNSIFYWGDPGTPYRIYKPNAGTHNDFSATGTGFSGADAIDINLGDGQAVTGGVALTKGVSIIFKTGSIHLMTGANATDAATEPLTFTVFSDELGCLSPDTIVVVGPEVYFLSPRGFKRLSYVSVTGNITSADPMYNAQPILDTFDVNRASEANAVFNPKDRQIYLTFPTTDGPLTTLVYNVVTGGIMQRDGMNTTNQVFDKLSQVHLFSRAEVGAAPVRIYEKDNSNSYDGVFYASEWESLFQATGSMNQRKMFSKFLAYFRTFYGTGVQVGVRIVDSDGSIETRLLDFGESTGTDGWDVGQWDIAQWDYALASVARQSRLGRGVAISVFFRAQAGAAFWVDRIELDSEGRGPDRR